MTSFGESAPAEELMSYFGFTVDNVVAVVEERAARRQLSLVATRD